MIDRPPEIIAAASLSPVSPRPLPLSSPLIVPALQTQADVLCGMSLTGESANATGSVPEAAAPESGEQIQHTTEATADQSLQDSINTSNDMGIAQDETDGALKSARLAVPDTNIDGHTEHFSADSAAVSGLQNGSSQSNKSTDTSPQSESVNQPPAETASLDTSDSIVETAPSSSVLPVSQSEGESHPQPEISSSVNQTDNATQQSNQNTADQSQPIPTESTPVDAIDIQKLVDDITARASASNPPQPQPLTDNGSSAPQIQESSSIAQTSSLPPKPPVPETPVQPSLRFDDLARFQQGGQPSPTTSIPPQFASTSGIPNPSAGAPGTTGAPHATIPPPHYSLNDPVNNTAPGFYYDASPSQTLGNGNSLTGQTYDQFLLDEKKYVSEAKWDKFPEGSRLFIGNLSSERATKREVFDIFGQYGRLAQISLKQAYGFVQYHTFEEGQAAMKHLQGMEIKGRKIHLEYSRPQKKDNADDRQRDNKSRGAGSRRDQDRFDGRSGRRDDYGRASPPRRDQHRRTDSYGRDRGGHNQGYDGYRGRSRSPPGYDRRSNERRRSPSPHRRQHSQAELNIPRRYGSDIPDVQILLLQEVDRNFVGWVQRSLQDLHLRVDVMFLAPHFPRNEVIQRQVMEGVHAVSEIDYRAQSLGKIPLQVFDRSAGANNVRFDQYQDLDPTIAGQLVLRTKSQAAPQQPTYNTHYAAPQAGYSYGAPPPQAAPQVSASFAGVPTTAAGLANLDNATLQKILASIQGQQAATPTASAPNHAYSQQGGYNPPPPSGVPGYPGYAQAAPATQPLSGGADSNQLVQNIMAQLSQFRQ